MFLSGGEKSLFYNTVINNTLYGLSAYTQHFELRRSIVHNTTSHCLSLTQSENMTIVDFELTTLTNCSDHGIYLSGPGQTTILNIVINNASVGVGSRTQKGNVEIRSSYIYNASQAINIYFTDANSAGNFTVENCNISDCRKGIELRSDNYISDSAIIVSRNTFTNVSSIALSILQPSYYYYRYNTNQSIAVHRNVFHNSCGIHIETRNSRYMYFKDNVITDSTCYSDNKCYITLYANSNRYVSTRLIDFSTNLLQNISAPCIVHLKSEQADTDLVGTVLYNQLIANSVAKGIVLVESERFNICRNIFDNPASSFDVYTEAKGTVARFITVDNVFSSYLVATFKINLTFQKYCFKVFINMYQICTT